MKVALFSAFSAGSHRYWTEGVQRVLRSESVDLHTFTLEGRFWKWRMQMGAIALAKQVREQGDGGFDRLIATDMVDLPTLYGLLRREFSPAKLILYFHENQLSYPWSTQERQREVHRRYLGALNIKSALLADRCCFNSQYHKNSFLKAVGEEAVAGPDYPLPWIVKEIEEKSTVLPVGISFPLRSRKALSRPSDEPLTILWNHRWEHDKNPTPFFETLFALSREKVPFRLIVLGEPTDVVPPIFVRAREQLADHLVHWGYVSQRAEYDELLLQSDLLPVTSHHDFFGISVLEAIALGVRPLLPNRLVYPEHFSPDTYPECFYRGEGELLGILRDLLVKRERQVPPGLIEKSRRYSWENLAEQYKKTVFS
ncbi:DUF3524 domain-containing protein [bacterium]|nr:DUF3524 domain-containing protein [bacterium]